MMKKVAAAILLAASLVTGVAASAGAGYTERPGCPSRAYWNMAARLSLPHSFQNEGAIAARCGHP